MIRASVLFVTATASLFVAAAAAARPGPPKVRAPGTAAPQTRLPPNKLPPAAAPQTATPPALLTGKRATGAGTTHCASCHVVADWSKVNFNHDPTGFPLRGAHQQVRCRDCHAHDFSRPVADSCSGCHRDRHQSEFGLQCEGCHDEVSWRPLLQADAHRRSLFPLTGRHALIPCQECHGNMRDRTFTRAPLGCVSCHRVEYDRARLISIDHVAAGFGTECQTCHATEKFTDARFDDHDTCFRISAGAHQGISCRGCHSGPPGSRITGACNTSTATCTGCHSHECARSDRQHTSVMGYECSDRKCFECHRRDGF